MSHIKHVPNPWDEFLDLGDVDESTYAAKTGQFVRVNASPDGLEFTNDVLQKSGGVMTGDDFCCLIPGLFATSGVARCLAMRVYII